MKVFCCLAFFSLSLTASAKLIESYPLEEFTAFDPKQKVHFNLQLEQIKLSFDDKGYMLSKRMKAIYQTESIEELEDYVVVQYIKGCIFSSSKKKNQVEKYLNVNRDFFGRKMKFRHPHWVIDSIDKDPVYATSANYLRHDLYRWRPGPNSTDEKEFEYYYRQKPEFPQLYVTDAPTAASYSAYPETDTEYAKNVALEFSTCLIRTEDVPYSVAENDISLKEKAIKCFDWNIMHVFDFAQKKFIAPKTMPKICR